MPTTTYYRCIMMPLRDGVRLATDVYLPDRKGRFPVIVIRSPYPGTGVLSSDALEFCQDGVGMVIQNCRGTENSEGDADLWRQEKEDGEDFLNWISEQDWFNGRLVTNGESYPGGTQWQAARAAHPVMVGLTPHDAPTDVGRVAYYPGGAAGFGIGAVWSLGMHNKRTGAGLEIGKKICSLLPLKEMDRLCGFKEDWAFWKQWTSHSVRDSYWESMNAEKDVSKMTAAAYVTGGWFDIFLPQTLSGFALLRKNGASRAAREFTRCVIEPLDHDGRPGELDYGPGCYAGVIALRNRFMKNILKDPEQDPLPDQPPLKLFVMGSNRWIESDSWPLPGTEYVNFYLHSGGNANTLIGDGSLDLQSPSREESPDRFLYNPLDPVPTAGGNNLTFFPAGQREQSEVEKRSDVLVYTSAPLEEDLDVIGEVKALIYASSSAVDTDFTVKLADVFPDGKVYNVCDGILRARFRNGPDREVFLVPGGPAEFLIDCWATGMTFLKGHRIRVEVSSSNFPRFDRNPNTGHPFGSDSEMKIARQTVYHDPAHPSRIVLPLFRPSGNGNPLRIH